MPDVNKDIPQYPRSSYVVDIQFKEVEHQLANYTNHYGLDLLPDFQRGHVWTLEQRSKYVEYLMRGGEGGKEIYFNAKNWDGTGRGDPSSMVILDGLQRLTSVRMFMRDEVPVLGYLKSEWTGAQRFHIMSLKFRIFSLPTRKDVLKFYLDLNAGGTPHGAQEIARVRKLLRKEKK